MHTFIQAAAAFAVVMVGFVGLSLVGFSPTPGSAPDAIDTASWPTYVSDRYGFSIGHPADWAVEHQAEDYWTMAGGDEQRSFETFSSPDENGQVGVSAWSVAVEPGTTAKAWIASYCLLYATPCTAIDELTEPVTMDGHPGSLVRFDTTQAFVLVDDRMYVVAVWRPESDPTVAPYGGASRLLEGFLSTMRLLPGGPAT